jgi:hypothetical protein
MVRLIWKEKDREHRLTGKLKWTLPRRLEKSEVSIHFRLSSKRKLAIECKIIAKDVTCDTKQMINILDPPSLLVDHLSQDFEFNSVLLGT